MPFAQPVAALCSLLPASTAPAVTGEIGPLSIENGNMPATPASAPSTAPRPHVFAYVAGAPPQTRARSMGARLVMPPPGAAAMPALTRENDLRDAGSTSQHR